MKKEKIEIHLKKFNVILKSHITFMEKTHSLYIKNLYDIYSQRKNIEIIENGNKIGSLNIDERGFNIIYMNSPYNDKNGLYFKVSKYVQNLHQKLKESNPDYGTYVKYNFGIDGKYPLGVHKLFEYIKRYEMRLRNDKLKRIL